MSKITDAIAKRGPGEFIADMGCGLAFAGVVVCAAVALCMRIVRWGLS